jgi:hypothetical protein
MNSATLTSKDNAVEPMLYMALELSNKTWRVTFGDGTRRRHMSAPAGERIGNSTISRRRGGAAQRGVLD